MDSRLEELERFDRWLLSRTHWELRQIALLLALAINIPQAWILCRMPLDTDAVISVFRKATAGQPQRWASAIALRRRSTVFTVEA